MFRMLSMLPVFVAIALPVHSGAGQKKEETKNEEGKKGIAGHIKWETKEFEKVIETDLKLKMKSFSLAEGVASPFGAKEKATRVRLLLEFTKDVDSIAIQNIESAFSTRAPGIYTSRLEFLFFDDDNVRIAIIGKDTTLAYVDGAVTGKTGEAFRVYADTANDEILGKTKRVEVRMHLADHAKAKDKK